MNPNNTNTHQMTATTNAPLRLDKELYLQGQIDVLKDQLSKSQNDTLSLQDTNRILSENLTEAEDKIRNLSEKNTELKDQVQRLDTDIQLDEDTDKHPDCVEHVPDPVPSALTVVDPVIKQADKAFIDSICWGSTKPQKGDRFVCQVVPDGFTAMYFDVLSTGRVDGQVRVMLTKEFLSAIGVLLTDSKKVHRKPKIHHDDLLPYYYFKNFKKI